VTILVELVRARSGQQRHFRTFGDFACDKSKGAGKAAVDGGQFVAADKTVGLGARYGRIALHIRQNQVQLGSAQRFYAAGVIAIWTASLAALAQPWPICANFR